MNICLSIQTRGSRLPKVRLSSNYQSPSIRSYTKIDVRLTPNINKHTQPIYSHMILTRAATPFLNHLHVFMKYPCSETTHPM